MEKMERKPAQGMQFETGLTGTPYAVTLQRYGKKYRKVNHAPLPPNLWLAKLLIGLVGLTIGLTKRRW
ncbi:hypothetical protein FB595_12919 [Sphingobium sp. AEW010]|nr:hypothetical protein [Sphingobium sp. JAI105]TWC98174.1 hypothetical protein FB595_12919 [Sphingobium sp. AEW010]TWD18236.1 hypothetical protein FB596_13019 [Sphingobium sp. AEW013]TWD20774.1 hypothetical protein FB594_13015 [Sphingobium sp. AEW001]